MFKLRFSREAGGNWKIQILKRVEVWWKLDSLNLRLLSIGHVKCRQQGQITSIHFDTSSILQYDVQAPATALIHHLRKFLQRTRYIIMHCYYLWTGHSFVGHSSE
eukprot:scaffold4066_cov152-Skeletonema_menzelii.AAC.18